MFFHLQRSVFPTDTVGLMAEDKGEKNQEQAEVASPPDSPRLVPASATKEPIPALPKSLPLLPETTVTELTPNNVLEPSTSPHDATMTDRAGKGSTLALATQELDDEVASPQGQEQEKPCVIGSVLSVLSSPMSNVTGLGSTEEVTIQPGTKVLEKPIARVEMPIESIIAASSTQALSEPLEAPDDLVESIIASEVLSPSKVEPVTEAKVELSKDVEAPIEPEQTRAEKFAYAGPKERETSTNLQTASGPLLPEPTQSVFHEHNPKLAESEAQLPMAPELPAAEPGGVEEPERDVQFMSEAPVDSILQPHAVREGRPAMLQSTDWTKPLFERMPVASVETGWQPQLEGVAAEASNDDAAYVPEMRQTMADAFLEQLVPEPSMEPAPREHMAKRSAVPSSPVNRQPAPVGAENLRGLPRSMPAGALRLRARDVAYREGHALRPGATDHVVENDRPPAPSPPVSRARPRHAPTFDDTSDSDSSLILPRRQARGGEVHLREASRGPTYLQQPTYAPQAAYAPQPTYPHQPTPTHFASRVPVEPYSNNPLPPPPPPPSAYHPRHYPGAAPPYYQNHPYSLSQQTGYSNPNPYATSLSSSSSYPEPWNYYQPGYPPHGSPTQHHDSYRGMPVLENGLAIQDGSGDVFTRIANTIPDLHVLLARYKETHSQLSLREDLLRRSSLEQEEKLRAKDDEIDALKDKISNLQYKHSTDTGRLRLEIGNWEEQAKEFRHRAVQAEKSKEEARLAHDAAMTSWESRYRALEDSYVALQRSAAEEKAKAWTDFHEWKSTATTRHDAEKIALAIQFDKKLKEADILADIRRQEAAEAFAKEKDELEAKLNAARRDCDEALRHERESRDAWLAERALLEAQHKKDKEDSEKAWMKLHAEERAIVDELTSEKEELLRKCNELKAESQKEKATIKSVATNLESEKFRLEKLMECYGDIAEIKSKGDAYYTVSFSQLQKQIIDLATTHFVHLPVRPPTDDLAQVPMNLPSFLGDTKASRQLRATYVVHTISKLITYRVFGPFLFSLGRRYDKADSLFLSMSNHIRDKSTRKEAIWRQQTLLAAFTSSGAKQRINTAAGTVVEEIVNAIKHFADPKEEESIKIGVKRIVKIAAETWRFARLEREMITATMPALQDEEHRFTSPEYWPAYLSDSTTTTSSGAQPQLLLRLFPVIYRESKHENFNNDGEQPDTGCVYHHGLALYDNAEPVLRRAEELKSAGLPSFTTASPTNAECGKFPPPVVPPHRESPSCLPETETVMSICSMLKSPPSLSPSEVSGRASIRHITPPSARSLNRTQDVSTPPSRVLAYQRPPPAPIDFPTPRNIMGLPLPVESMFTSNRSNSMQASTASRAPILPLSVTGPADSAPPESSVFSESFYELSVQENSNNKDPPTPPHSCSSTPTRPASPLFEAAEEIETVQPPRRRPSMASRRRSSHMRHRSEDEIPSVVPLSEQFENKRRSTISNRTSRTTESERSERTDKSDRTERLDKARYMYESRSAAMKALYPNSPVPGQSDKSSRDSIRSSKKKDRDSRELKREKSAPSAPTNVSDMFELRRQRSIPDNGTWDTTSYVTGIPAATQISTRRRQKSIPDNGTWDTASVMTSDPAASYLSKRRTMSIMDNETWIPDNGTWDTISFITGDPTGTHLSRRETESISDNGTWDTSSFITNEPAKTEISANRGYKQM